MATEIARLMMAVDSSQVRGATRDLQGMSGAASGLGKMLGGLAIGGTLAAIGGTLAAMAKTATTPSTAVWPEWARKALRRVMWA